MIKINKDKWSDSSIEQIVDEVNDRVDNPSQSEFQRFVGLEDFESGQFKIKKWGSTENLVSAMKLFKKGDLLFARRNAYLKRASEVDFDGVCSGDAIVLREKSKIEKGLLTFILNTDRFWEYAIANAAGTMSKRVKWRDLAKYKFLLPPPAEQKQIAALFQSIEMAIEQVDVQDKNLHQLKHKLLRDLFSEKQEFGNHLNSIDFETVKFEKIAINISERVEPKKTELNTYVGLEHLDADNLKIERTGTPDDVIGTKLKIYKGDIIFGKRRAYLRKVAVSHFDGIASAHSMILRANEKHIERDFLPFFMQSDTFMIRAVQISEGSLSPTIKNKTLAMQEFILPKKEKQKELISVFKEFDTTMEQLKQQKITLKNLKQKLLNKILG
jgi:type I restriction enzyme S subunit